MIENTIYQLFRNTRDPVFGIDRESRIRYWNEPCEGLMGLSHADVINQKCYEVIRGDDLAGNPYCRPDCHVSIDFNNGNPVNAYDLIVQGADGNSILMNVGAYITPEKNRKKIECTGFLSLRRIDCNIFIKRIKRKVAFDANVCTSSMNDLTKREIEILKLASEGMSTNGIADKLSISPLTVRNHFKNIFSKLNVHSRSEATFLALRSNFFESFY